MNFCNCHRDDAGDDYHRYHNDRDNVAVLEFPADNAKAYDQIDKAQYVKHLVCGKEDASVVTLVVKVEN